MSGTSGRLELLPWDTAHFGLRIGKIAVDGDLARTLIPSLESGRRDGFDVLYIYSDQPIAVPDLPQMRLMDRKITFGRSIRHADQRAGHEGTSDCIGDMKPPLDDLYDLAVQSAHCSRFTKDPGFPKGLVNQLYHRWIDRAIASDDAIILVYRELGQTTGFLTIENCQINPCIGLFAVDKRCRGRGTGKRLLREALSRCAHRSLATLDVTTQEDNTAACALYRSMGFEPVRRQFVYHLWMST